MPATSYSPVSWSPSEIITDERMQQNSDNVQWVFDNTPRALYTNPSGLKRPNGIRFVGGKALITARPTDTAQVRVQFGNAFSNGCLPIITTGNNNSFQNKVFVRIQGTGELQPNHTGFQIAVEVAATLVGNDKISNNFFVHWIALGY